MLARREMPSDSRPACPRARARLHGTRSKTETPRTRSRPSPEIAYSYARQVKCSAARTQALLFATHGLSSAFVPRGISLRLWGDSRFFAAREFKTPRPKRQIAL